VEGLRLARERRARFFLRYMLSRDDESLRQIADYQREMVAGVAAYRALGVSSDEERSSSSSATPTRASWTCKSSSPRSGSRAPPSAARR